MDVIIFNLVHNTQTIAEEKKATLLHNPFVIMFNKLLNKGKRSWRRKTHDKIN